VALVQPLARPAVAAGPERARRTGGSFLIAALFLWTADDSVRQHDGPCSGLVDEREHLFRSAGIIANIGLSENPVTPVSSAGTMPTATVQIPQACYASHQGSDVRRPELGGSGMV